MIWTSWQSIKKLDWFAQVCTCKSSSIRSSMVIIPIASSSSFSFGRGLSLICKTSAESLAHFLLFRVPLLDPCEFAGKLFHLCIGLLPFTLFSAGFSIAMSNFKSSICVPPAIKTKSSCYDQFHINNWSSMKGFEAGTNHPVCPRLAVQSVFFVSQQLPYGYDLLETHSKYHKEACLLELWQSKWPNSDTWYI